MVYRWIGDDLGDFQVCCVSMRRVRTCPDKPKETQNITPQKKVRKIPFAAVFFVVVYLVNMCVWSNLLIF